MVSPGHDGIGDRVRGGYARDLCVPNASGERLDRSADWHSACFRYADACRTFGSRSPSGRVGSYDYFGLEPQSEQPTSAFAVSDTQILAINRHTIAKLTG